MQNIYTDTHIYITYRLIILLFVHTWFEAWLSRRWPATRVFTATAVVISMTMLPMPLVVSSVPAVFLATTTSMLLPMLLKPYWQPTLSCCRSQETLQFLPSPLLQAFSLTATVTATTTVTQLKQTTTIEWRTWVPTNIVLILPFPKPTGNHFFDVVSAKGISGTQDSDLQICLLIHEDCSSCLN
jgi:hypothetical protein